MDHVVWMIDHHPEWDGFLLNLSRPGYGAADGDEADRVRDAWFRQIGSEHRSGMVLHHAAMFLEWGGCIEHAKRVLLASPDWVIVAGAVHVPSLSPKGHGGDWGVTMRARLRELSWGEGQRLPSRSPQYRRSLCPVVPLLR